MRLARHAGHLPGLALSGLRHVGRGFAAQQLIEEWAARRALSAKVRPTADAPAAAPQRAAHMSARTAPVQGVLPFCYLPYEPIECLAGSRLRPFFLRRG